MKTKIFCDSADLKTIKEFNNNSLVSGFTTNPSLIRKAGAKNYTEYCKNILKITKKPISFEVFADDTQNIIKQAQKIKKDMIVTDNWNWAISLEKGFRYELIIWEKGIVKSRKLP